MTQRIRIKKKDFAQRKGRIWWFGRGTQQGTVGRDKCGQSSPRGDRGSGSQMTSECFMKIMTRHFAEGGIMSELAGVTKLAGVDTGAAGVGAMSHAPE